MKQTIYIAGKITGLPYRRTYLKFLIRELFLILMGYNTINPMRAIPKNYTWDEAMAECLLLVEMADVVYISHNWRRSKGAYKEVRHALRLNKPIVSFTTDDSLINN